MALTSWRQILGSPCRDFRNLHAISTGRSSFCRKSSLSFDAPTEADMGVLASHLAAELQPGDCYCLYGDVGAGKSVFSRAFIRAAAEDPELPVPSPTFLLMNAYDEHGEPPIHHFDLYRLTSSSTDETALQRLNLRESTSTAVCLIEWAERLQSQCPENHLSVHISIKLSPSPLNISQEVRDTSSLPAKNSGEEQEEEDIYTDQRSRRVTLTPHGTRWRTRLLTLVESLSMAKHGGLNVIKGYE